MQRYYFDYAGTTPVDPKVLEAMQPYFFDTFGNASSLHSFGQAARRAMEKSRASVAAFLGAKEEEIIFTSGGTESNNFALHGVGYANEKKGNHIITSAIEHHAILEPAKFLATRGFKVTCVKVDSDGMVNPDDIKAAITDKTTLISIMHANNEIGTIQPIKTIADIAHSKNIPFHTDAVQTVGHIPTNVDELGVDLLSLSAHKLCGPKGVGVLYVRKGTKIVPFLRGGGQENHRRASTSNVSGIVGLGKALELCKEKMSTEAKEQTRIRDRIISELKKNIPDIFLNGHQEKRLPNNVNISVEGVEGEAMLLNLDMLGIAVSTGSACTSGDLEPSHVLLAIGRSHELCHGSVRFTLGRFTKPEELDYLFEQFPKVIKKLRAMSPLYNKAQ